jgi:hypothetical protein
MRKLLLLLFLVWACPAWAVIAPDGSPASVDNGAGASTTVQVSMGAVTAADFIVCHFSFEDASSNAFTSLQNASGDNFVQVSLNDDTGVGQWTGIYYRQNITANSNERTLTLKYTVSKPFGAMSCAAFSGGVTSGPLVDVVPAVKTATSTNPTSNSATTTCNGDLVVGLAQMNANTPTVGAGFTTMGSNSTTLLFSEYKVQSTAGSIAANWTASSDTWYAQMGTFFAAGASCGSGKNMPAAVY